MKHTKCYVEGYPRPQFVRNNFMLLDGEWEFDFDPRSKGEEGGWHKKHDFPLTIRVPYSYHTKKSGIGREEACRTVWYRRTFSADLLKSEKLLLHFDGADYFTKVWLNGIYLGSHEGGYARFSFDVTPFLRHENVLTVMCEDGCEIAKPRGKQRWTEQSVSCFYVETTGIWKSVWLERVPARYFESVSQEILFSEDSVRFRCFVRGAKPGAIFRVSAEFEGKRVNCGQAELSREGYGEVTLRLVNASKILPEKFWSPATPNLFDLTYSLLEGGRVVDEAGSYCALVRYDTQGGNLRINYGQNAYMRMVLDQGYSAEGGLTLDAEELERDVKLIKEMGFNGVRKHEKIEDERFCYFCDVYGLVMWLEMPSAYDFTEEGAARFCVQWQEIVRQYQNFPCIMAYVPFNESWGIMHVAENARQQAFTQAAYYLTKTYCPDRLVISNDGWEHTKSDLLTVHNYAESGTALVQAYGDAAAYAGGERMLGFPPRSAFANGFGYDGQPLLVSECAGISFVADNENGGWGYGKAAADEEEYLRKLASIVGGIYSIRPCAGFCVTQFTDVMQEKNGLLSEERVPKASLERIREIVTGSKR